MHNRDPLYLDDLYVGQTFISGKQTMDQEQMIDFARQFDPQPFHVDPVAAENTPFRGLAASGWHTTAISMRLLVNSLPISQGIIGAGAEIDWPRPTRAGDCLQVVTTVKDIKPSRSKPDRGVVTRECLTMNQLDEICQRMVTKVFVMKKMD